MIQAKTGSARSSKVNNHVKDGGSMRADEKNNCRVTKNAHKT